jgi:hypothetical protein
MENQAITYKEQIIVVAEELDRRVLLALRHTKKLSDEVSVFGVFSDAAQEHELRQRWSTMAPEVPLILKLSDNGGIAEPLLDYLLSMEGLCIDGPGMVVLLPRLIAANWLSRLLRMDNSKYLERRLAEEGFAVEVFPIQLKSDHASLAPNKPAGSCGE